MVDYVLKYEPEISPYSWRLYENGHFTRGFLILEIAVRTCPNADVDRPSYERWMKSVFNLVACRLVG